MQNMTTLGKVSDRVDELSKNCTDRMVKVKNISFDSLKSVRVGAETHQMRPIAKQSICYRLGIPIQYLRRCPADIQAYNMNHWIKQERNEELFFRFDEGDVRAVFTPKYVPVDNFEVLERLDSMGYGPDTPVQCSLDAEFMSLSIPDGKKTFLINGDEMRPGISISNSEVGLAALGVAAFILRLVCTNGLIAKTEINNTSYRHVSGKILNEFPDVIKKVAYAVEGQRKQLRISIESRVDNPPATIEIFNRQFQLGNQEKDAVNKWAWPIEAGNTMFNIVNTYTRAAQFKELSSESSYKLQKVAGNILGMLK